MTTDRKPIDPQAAMDAIWAMAPKYAKAKGERVYIEEFRKTLKATLMKRCDETAIGAQEREAYAHEEYAQHLKALQAAVEAEEALRWRLVAAQAAIEIWRSMEASNRGADRAAR
jgi:hypothetical protein